uniref:NUC153 domain-containing protein n=1 Tax=Steinernema glaseri TaxID=37863 RepID=A0A1I7ZKS1_9BILA
MFPPNKFSVCYGVLAINPPFHTDVSKNTAKKRADFEQRAAALRTTEAVILNMQLSTTNDVKIYNLSAGKSLPDWITERKRRKLEQKDVDVRRRIQLVQGFDMPDVSGNVTVTPDGRFVFATGAYKPFIKCFDLEQLSIKFSRGLDCEAIKMVCLSEDYSKFIVLEDDRYLEMHATFGRYFRMRIPKAGRDMAYSREASDLFVVAAGSDIYRLNLEEGRFLEPLHSPAPSLTCCEFNDYHQLFVAGTEDGCVEAYDHRDRSCVATLNCSLGASYQPKLSYSSGLVVPEVTAVRFKDALHLAVGTSTGQILMYDIRSSKPMLVRDQMMGLPIRKLDFVPEHDLVLSMDSRILKMWDGTTGKPFTSIEPGTTLSDFTRYPDSGLLFFANEAPKMLQYFVPAIGTAPKWCSYLETITEELEETDIPTVYDDYKFLTKDQLEEVGLANLIGTSMLRAYMHGYFIDSRLYEKAKTLTQPFAFEKYKERKLRDLIEEERRTDGVAAPKKTSLPKVNTELAEKLYESVEFNKQLGDKSKKTQKKIETATALLTDDRFKGLFSNPDFEVDETSEQYQQILPALKLLEKKERKKELKVYDDEDEGIVRPIESGLFMDDAVPESGSSTDEEDDQSDDGSNDESGNENLDGEDEVSGGEDHATNAMSMTGTTTNVEDYNMESDEEAAVFKPKGFRLIGVERAVELPTYTDDSVKKDDGTTLGARKAALKATSSMAEESDDVPFGGKTMTFKLKSRKQDEETQKKEHVKERKASRRKATMIRGTRGRGSRGRGK